ncbi:hypothetical protein GIB67_040549 [Kingdonia uniflora]|uniref:HTH myb-type domain-containing protein n=1 Tax=Kingdonia uniflora TaxID=39325 RepID=A0A7J7L5C5_9MAGN|nr:hypothetical protein GIB67_040549 [Kingdonia uniflora]
MAKYLLGSEGVCSEEKAQQRVFEWEVGLPTAEDLPPLSLSLITPELASAFSITPEPHRTVTELKHAFNSTLSNIHQLYKGAFTDDWSSMESPDAIQSLKRVHEQYFPVDEYEGNGKKSKLGCERTEISNEDDHAHDHDHDHDHSVRTLKRQRLVWTPQLHKRFVGVVEHVGMKDAVPKTIMEMMNVEGLTRDNVASHLQKYRLYKKRMEGVPTETASLSDNLFASSQIGYGLPLISMQALGGYGNMGMPVGGRSNSGYPHHYNR